MIASRDIAVAIGHFNMPGAVALNLHMIRKHNGDGSPVIVTDDCSPPDAMLRLVSVCDQHNAMLLPGTRRLGHVGGDLRAFWHGLQFARDAGCAYLMKLSQRAVYDTPDWLTQSASLLHRVGAHTGASRAGLSNGVTVAHIRTSAIMLHVPTWCEPETLDMLKPRELAGVACEWIVARCLQRIGGVFVGLPFSSNVITASRPGELWHDDPASGPLYRALAEREGIDLGPEFHIGGSNVLPDGSPDQSYRG